MGSQDEILAPTQFALIGLLRINDVRVSRNDKRLGTIGGELGSPFVGIIVTFYKAGVMGRYDVF